MKVTLSGWLVAALVLALAPASALANPGHDPLGPIEADRARIRQHLSRVERELRAVDTSTWPQSQREARGRALDTLHRYTDRGVFPRNTGHPGTTHPYFIDDEGRACAVAHLMIESGASELAHAVQRDHGLDYVADMRTPGIARWAQRSGLSVDELAAIQPGYCNCEDDPQFDPVCGDNGVSYWNSCVAEVCGGVPIAYAGACADPEITCEPPYVTQCGGGISYGLCSPVGGGDVEQAWEHEAVAWLEDPDCPEPGTDLVSRGCTCAADGRAGGSAMLGLGMLVLVGWRRRSRRP